MIVSVNCFNEQSSNHSALQAQVYTKCISSCGLTDAIPCLFSFWDSGSRVGHYLGESFSRSAKSKRQSRTSALTWLYGTSAHMPLTRTGHISEPNRCAEMCTLTARLLEGKLQYVYGPEKGKP